MGATALAIIGPPPALNEPLVQGTLDLWASAGDRPPIVPLAPRQIHDDSACLAGVHAAWIHSADLSPASLTDLLDLLQERHLPILLTPPAVAPASEVARDERAGIALCPPTASPSTALAMLRVCWVHAACVRGLAYEVKMLQIQHRSLCEQIDKIDQELRLASQMQREFLPSQFPAVYGVDFAALFRPATYVSGDIYDIVPLDGRHVAFFLADAVGHGVPAAMMTVFIAQCLRTMALNWPATGLPPSKLPGAAMAELNQQMIRQQSSKVRTATACFGLIDCQPGASGDGATGGTCEGGARQLWFARAGHPSAIVLRTHGEEQMLEPDGGLLGVFEDGEFEVQEVSLRPGDRLLVHSDGFEIAFRGLPTAAHDRIANPDYAREFADLVDGPVDAALQRLAQKLDQQVGSLNQLDDLTAILIGTGCGLRAEVPAAASLAA
jgi:phosphoserine phosphatase RsbU/P